MNTSEDVAILVVSCDAYRDLWHPFFHCFFKYWPDCPYPIYLGSNCLTFPDSRVRPILVGPDADYSTNLIEMLGHIEQEWIILWIEDRLLSAPVDTGRVRHLIDMAKRGRAGFVKLIASPPYATAVNGTAEVGEIPRGTRYRVCITVALWKRAVLLALLRPGETAWQIERQGSARSDELDERFLSLSIAARDEPPICDAHLVTKGRLIRDALPFLRREGLLPDLAGRPLQTMSSRLYVLAYMVFVNVRDYLRWRAWMVGHRLSSDGHVSPEG